MKQRILSLLVALLALTTGAWADDDYELTVHDSKAISNSSIPFYGSYMNNYTRNEMIYPAAELAVMSGADITSLTFYKTDDITESWGAASFKIYLMEVSNSTLSAYIGMTGATVVYEGSVDATGGERPVTINFTTPYRYNGGNLLVGVYQTVKGSASIAAFCGQLGFDASSGTSSGSYDSQDAASAPFSQQDFLPKTTFTYKPAPFDYELTVEASDHGSGQVKFFIDGKEVEGAYETDEGKTVTVKVTPDEGWRVDDTKNSHGDVTALLYRYWEGSRRAAAKIPMQRTVDLKYEDEENGVFTYSFTMPASNVKVKAEYLKVSTLYFDPAEKTNLMEVKVDGLVRNVEDSKTFKIEKVERVTEGAPVTLTANTGYKFRKVEVKKGDAADNAYLKWDANQKKLVATEIPATATTVTNADTNDEWAAGTYVVEGDVTINGNITLGGNVDLIIKDGAKLTVNGRIHGSSSKYNLSIYGQANQSGQLVVNNPSNDAIASITTLEVHSCQVTASSSGNNRGGFYGIVTFNVYGGSVDGENTGDTRGYGIHLSVNGSMNIYGGDVKAVGKGDNSTYSYGITGSTSSSSSITVTVYGGKLWAENADQKALLSAVTLAKGAGFTGKIEYSSDKSAWSETADASAKYVRVGY